MTTQTLKGVIFDHGVLLDQDSDTTVQLRKLMNKLRDLGLSLIVFSTHPQNLNKKLSDAGLPAVDHFITKRDVPGRKPKGSPVWIDEAATRAGVETFQLAYVGDDEYDWYSAMHSAIFYIHAGWSKALPSTITALQSDSPYGVYAFLTHFMLTPPRWQYSLDLPGEKVHLRSLLHANTELRSTNPTKQFKLQPVLGGRLDVKVGNFAAQDLLMLHALSSLMLEGMVPSNPKSAAVAVYPSHTPNTISAVLKAFLEPASKLIHGYFKDDLLVRAAAAPDTSLVRYKMGSAAQVTYTEQANTIHVNDKYKNLIENKTVLVFDDFATSGKCLDWARNLLVAAGAERIILMTIGKYQHDPRTEIYNYIGSDSISPYTLNTYKEQDFSCDVKPLVEFEKSPEILKASFEKWAERRHLTI